jgi:hypothetical protein
MALHCLQTPPTRRRSAIERYEKISAITRKMSEEEEEDVRVEVVVVAER